MATSLFKLNYRDPLALLYVAMLLTGATVLAFQVGPQFSAAGTALLVSIAIAIPVGVVYAKVIQVLSDQPFLGR